MHIDYQFIFLQSCPFRYFFFQYIVHKYTFSNMFFISTSYMYMQIYIINQDFLSLSLSLQLQFFKIMFVYYFYN